MNAQCIICLRSHVDETVEHIIPSSLGNEYYVLPKGKVCYTCNNRFAKVENKVVSSDVFLNERKRLRIQPNNSSSPGSLNENHLTYLLVKMGFEGLYHSKRRLWNLYDWDEVRNYLNKKVKPAVVNDRELPINLKFKPIPKLLDRFRLRNNYLSLEYGLMKEKLYIRFQFGRIQSWVRLQ